MALQPGTRLGPYEIVDLRGKGGMGEVYRARDTRLGRDVALKVLPDHVKQDPQLRQRFEREARTVSQIQHPHICALHDVGSDEDKDFLVMEYLEGVTLETRIRRGPLPVAEAVEIGAQIAEATDAAHRNGVVHRDLKPANVMLTPSGVKVLDFGLAKEIATLPLAADTASPTAALPLTVEGTIAGTLFYMAPEQVEGKEADARTDIWALGCILYEMASGHRPFTAESPAGLMSAILQGEPQSLDEVRPELPAHLGQVIARCLTKDPERRWQSAADLGFALAAAGSRADEPDLPLRPAASHRWRFALSGLAMGVLVGSLATWTVLPDLLTRAPGPDPPQRLSINLPEALPLARMSVEQGNRNMALSPDGRVLVYVAQTARQTPGARLLVRRRLGALEAEPLPGTEGAYEPFFSPDGEWLAYFVEGGLRKIRLAGGSPQPLYEDEFLIKFGGSWGEDGFLYFVDVELRDPWLLGRLLRVPEEGGAPEIVLEMGSESSQGSPLWPAALPGGRGLLVAVRSQSWRGWGGDAENVRVEVLSLDSGQRRVLVERATMPRFVRIGPETRGHVLYAQAGRLMSLPFDAESLAATGPPFEVTEPQMKTALGGSAPRRWDVSENGRALVYAKKSPSASLVKLATEARGEALEGAPVPWWGLSVSPDGRRLAVGAEDADIWIYDLERGSSSRLTLDPAKEWQPIWTPDGRRIAFTSNRGGNQDIYWKRADGTGSAELLASSEHNLYPDSFTPDARTLVYNEWGDPATVWDLGRLPLAGGGSPELLVHTQALEAFGRLSPDGRWLAYQSDESGRWEIYVQPFPEMSERWQVSTEGGRKARWRPDGAELFYLDFRGLLSVPIARGSGFRAGLPTRLVEGAYDDFDVLPDGESFVMQETASAGDHELHVVLDFAAELERMTPPEG